MLTTVLAYHDGRTHFSVTHMGLAACGTARLQGRVLENIGASRVWRGL